MKRLSRFSLLQQLVMYYALCILVGTCLLLLPISQKSGGFDVSVIDALFTTVSAMCVTGLTVVDTLHTWSFFGQLVIIICIQIGGLGISSFIIFVLSSLRQGKTFKDAMLLQQDANFFDSFNIHERLKRMVKVSLCVEAIGALILALQFSQTHSTLEAIWLGIFHSVSAYCNAGFDLIGNFSSLISYNDNMVLMFTISLLIIIGGIGYPVFEDLIYVINKKRRELSFYSKVILSTTATLLVFGAISIFILEYQNALVGLTLPQKFMNAFFMSVTPRTAGFTTLDLTSLTQASQIITVILMFIGGAPASTAGGIKVSTIFVIFASVRAYLKGKRNPQVFKRKIASENVLKAYSIFVLYIILVFGALFVLSISESSVDFMTLVFEVVSAIGTVGSSLNLSPELTVLGKIIVSMLMFIGRLGALTIGIAILSSSLKESDYSYANGDILLG